MKFRTASMALPCLCMFTQVAKAAWMYDFASPPPPSFITTVLGPPSGTFSSSIAGGVLRLADSRTAAEGGAGGAASFETSQTFSDVRVEALVNPSGTSDDLLQVIGRVNLATSQLYGAGIDFTTGALQLVKVEGVPLLVLLSTDAGQGSQPRLTDLARSYYLRLDAVGNQINASVFDAPGGTELLHVDFTDTGAVGGPAYGAGLAGVAPIATGTLLDGTFDNVSASAIPEPSVAVLGIGAIVGLLGRRRRDRQREGCQSIENL